MKILYLAHRIPYPPNKGDKIRSFHQVKYLAQKYQLDLVCLADNPQDLKYQANLEKICNRVAVFPMSPLVGKFKGIFSLLSGKTISVAYFYQKQIQQLVDKWIEQQQYDAIVCFSSVMAEYIFRSSSSRVRSKLVTNLEKLDSKPPRLIMDFCDVDSDKWEQYSKDAAFPLKQLYRLEQKRLLKYESRINRYFDCSIFVTKNEADLFGRLYPPAKRLWVIRNGVDFEFFSPSAKFQRIEKSAPTLVFTGAMDYHANVDGVQWFCSEVWPQIREQVADCEFYIVGSNPTQVVKNLADLPGVTVTGFVDDIRSYYEMADLCVIPLRLARGVQNKALEAMSMGKAVITTTKVAEGVGAYPGKHLLVADDATEYLRSIELLFSENDQCEQIADSGQSFVRDTFDWESNMAAFNQLLSEG